MTGPPKVGGARPGDALLRRVFVHPRGTPKEVRRGRAPRLAVAFQPEDPDSFYQLFVSTIRIVAAVLEENVL